MNFLCGSCMRDNNASLKERKQMALSLHEGENKCDSCGTILVVENGWYKPLKEKADEVKPVEKMGQMKLFG